MVFEWFAELLMNTTRETVDPAMRAATENVCGDYPDIIPADTRNLMGFFISLRRLMMEVIFFFCPYAPQLMTDCWEFSRISAESMILRIPI